MIKGSLLIACLAAFVAMPFVSTDYYWAQTYVLIILFSIGSVVYADRKNLEERVKELESVVSNLTSRDDYVAVRTWWQILGVPTNASEEEIQKAYRWKAKILHPDRGGSKTQFQILQKAREDGLKARTKNGRH